MVTVGFLLLALAGALGILGLRQLLLGAAERAEIVGRATYDEPAGRAGALWHALNLRLRRTRVGDRVSQHLLSAGLDLRPLDFLVLVTAVAVLVLLVGQAFFPGWFAVLMAGGAVLGCRAWVNRRRDQRRDEFVAQLPELARVLSNGVSAGLSTTAALELAVRELGSPASDELGVVLGEVRLGQSLADGLSRLGRRIPSRELAVLVSTLVIQQRAGGDAVRALSDMSATLETRKDLIREVRTVMAGSVFSGWLVAGLGIGTIFLLNLLQPGVLDRMTSTPLGVVALVVAGIMYTIGLVLIRRVTRIET
ncbi:MAG: type II secretion system F family protein [Solirubrobacteraceae bacterium]